MGRFEGLKFAIEGGYCNGGGSWLRVVMAEAEGRNYTRRFINLSMLSPQFRKFRSGILIAKL